MKLIWSPRNPNSYRVSTRLNPVTKIGINNNLMSFFICLATRMSVAANAKANAATLRPLMGSMSAGGILPVSIPVAKKIATMFEHTMQF